MAAPLIWTLSQIWPQHGGLIDNLTVWRKSHGKTLPPAISFVKKAPSTARQLREYHEQDCRYAGRVGRHRGWRHLVGSTLLALQYVYQHKVVELFKKKLLPETMTWQMLNCQPAGGHWVADRYEEGFTGTRCGSPLCPWCYLRGFDEHVTRIRDMFNPNRKLRDVTVHLLKICPSAVKTLQAADQRVLQIYIGDRVRKRLKAPAYRLMGFPYFIKKGGAVTYNVRVGYFTAEAITWKDSWSSVRVNGTSRSVHFEPIPEVWIDHAVRHVWPYPIDLLSASCETIVEYLVFRKGRRDFGVVGASKAK